jgi:chromosomal replication initiator protein
MPALHHDTEDKDVLGKIKEALIQRIGADRFGLWFTRGVEFRCEANAIVVAVSGEFALQRLRVNYFRQIESAVAQAVGSLTPVRMELADEPAATPAVAPVDSSVQAAANSHPSMQESSHPLGFAARGVGRPAAPRLRTQNHGPEPLRTLLASDSAVHSPANRPASTRPAANRPSSNGLLSNSPNMGGVDRTAAPIAVGPVRANIRAASIDVQAAVPETASDNHSSPSPTELEKTRPHGDAMTFANFAAGSSNQLAHTAAQLLAANPNEAAPICFWGATGTGKTHLLHAIRHELRTRHRMPRVILLSAEDFTNDFLTAVRGGAGLPAFRKRYRDVDALLIDNIQFFGAKSATLREVLYTVDTIISRRRPLVLAGDRPPMEIEGLSGELAGRMSSGLVCGLNPLEIEVRRELLRRESMRSFMPWDEETIQALASRVSGDGRLIQGVGRLVSMLQRMYRRMPTMQEILREAGDMLQRGPRSVALEDIERAVCAAFNLPVGELRGEVKSRNVSQPRILAMYLSRQHTSAAFSEIGRYFGDRNHSTVIAAYRRAEAWLKTNQSVGGRGPHAIKVQEAIDTVENLLRIG